MIFSLYIRDLLTNVDGIRDRSPRDTVEQQ